MSEKERFEKWAKNNDFDIGKYSNGYNAISTRAAWEAWQAALSTRKPCGFVVINCEGKASKTFRKSQVEEAHKFVKFFNENDISGHPFRVVELFYEDSES